MPQIKQRELMDAQRLCREAERLKRSDEVKAYLSAEKSAKAALDALRKRSDLGDTVQVGALCLVVEKTATVDWKAVLTALQALPSWVLVASDAALQRVLRQADKPDPSAPFVSERLKPGGCRIEKTA